MSRIMYSGLVLYSSNIIRGLSAVLDPKIIVQLQCLNTNLVDLPLDPIKDLREASSGACQHKHFGST